MLDITHLNNKNDLRQHILKLLRSQKEDDRYLKSQQIADQLFKLPEVEQAKTILFYASFDGEVDTFAMMKQAIADQKTVALPKIDKNDKRIIPTQINNLDELNPGAYGISEPKDEQYQIDIQQIDIVIVPGVAFDQANNRLGRGAGYYDRFLKELPTHTLTIGLAFDFQIVKALPDLQDHDIPVSQMIHN